MSAANESNPRGKGAFKYELLLLLVVCQKRCSPAPTSIIMSLEAVFAALAGYLVLNQNLTGRAIVGCFLILLGALMVQLVPMMRKMKDGVLSNRSYQ